MKRRSLPPRGVVLRPLVGGAEALASCDRMRGGRGGQRLLLPSLAAFLKFHKLRRPRAGSHTGRLKETSATLEALRFPSQRQRGEAARPEAPRWAEGNKICLIPVLAPPPRRGQRPQREGPRASGHRMSSPFDGLRAAPPAGLAPRARLQDDGGHLSG